MTKKAVKKTKKKAVKKVEKIETAFDKLIDRHKLFVMNYIKNFGNGTRAYMDTYPNAKELSARAKSPLLLAKVSVKKAIEEKYAVVYANIQSELEKTKTYELIMALSDTDISQIVDLEGGTLKVKDLKDIPIGALHSIASLKYTKKEASSDTGSSIDKNIEVKLHNKLKALEMRARIQKLIDPKDESVQVDVIIKPAIRPKGVDAVDFEIEKDEDKE